ncbi:KR domain-containing protein [Amycolatopsis vastitatis]|uniref:Ketoreductase domain-containing protein n=1 Tax=Amycolatopsis vastitatis TaxID=1905142 RepID=A0A229T3S4_9PSEU|nr:KR domain-containing protein [Amycolatopsis vastitatis]OXM65906.1 hypothetical protein CF165_21210 [Amycolatopsis vastitatis]
MDDDGIVVELGARWRAGDATLVLEAIHAAADGGVPLTLVHRGAGGRSLLLAASAEWPRLTCREVVRDTHAAFRPRPERWAHHRLLPAGRPMGPTGIAISGGLGGLGLALAARLGAAGHRLWLLDRRPVSGLALADQHRLAAVARATRVVVHQSDVTKAVPDSPFPVTALVHAAGELELHPLRDIGAGRLERLAPAKAAALRTLVRALAPGGLRSVVVFGSAESRRPHPLFGGYALANELVRLEAARLRRKHRGVRLVTAEWSLWSDVGMAGPSAGAAAAAGFATVPPDWGAQAAELLLDAGNSVPGELVLGGPQPTPDRPLAAIAGVAGSSVARDGRSVDRLVALCRPVRGGRHRVAGGRGTVVRAVVDGRAVATWTSPVHDWADRRPG